MELKTFVTKTITDIISGIKDAQAATRPGSVVPSTGTSIAIAETGFSPYQIISFEVCVSIEETNGADGKVSVVGGVFGLGGGGSTKSEAKNATTVSFKVPVCFPAST